MTSGHEDLAHILSNACGVESEERLLYWIPEILERIYRFLQHVRTEETVGNIFIKCSYNVQAIR